MYRIRQGGSEGRRMTDPRTLWAELKQRKVVRTVGLYLAVAWGGVTVVGELTQILELPDWVPRLVLVIAALGLPVVLVVSWVFDWSDGEFRRAEPPVSRGPFPARLALGAALVSLALIAGTAVWMRRTRAADETDPGLIAVLPFTVRGAAEFAYLGDGMADLLSTKLDGSGGLMSVDPRAVVRLVERETDTVDPERAAGLAERLKARWFVLGSVVEAGRTLQVSASLYDREALQTPLGLGEVEGPAEGLFALVDSIASDLLVGMSGGPQAEVQRVAGVTTASLEAFKAYMDGETAYRHGEYVSALGHFKRAVAIDSTFALAYYRISTAAEWAWVEADVYNGADRAVSLADRLPERERRLVQVLGVRRRETNQNAEDVLLSFVGTYPGDVEAWANLGELVTHTRPMHGRSSLEAREVWNRVLAIDSTHAGALLHLMRLDAYEGNFEEMDARLRRFHALNPEADRSIEMDVLAVSAHADPAGEAAILRKLAVATDIDRAVGVWNASVYGGNLDLAVRICEQMAAPGRSVELRRAGLQWLASLEYARGQWRAARQALEELEAVDALAGAEFRAVLLTLPLSPATEEELEDAAARLASRKIPRWSGGPQLILDAHDGLHEVVQAYGLGVLSSSRGDSATAVVYADSLEAMFLPADHEQVSQDLALGIRARIELLGGRPQAAVNHLSRMRLSAWHGQSLFSPLYARTAERYLRGEALLKAGRETEALGWFEHIAENSPFEAAFLPAAFLRRAEIHASRGERQEAIRLYGRFLAVWGEADAELQATVAEVRARLQELQPG